MASSSSFLSEQQLQCPICLDVLTQPVSTPCGHNFCMSCLAAFWDGQAVSQCPLCKETFELRPDLRVNAFISELVSCFKASQVTDDAPACRPAGTVLCDVCTDVQHEAVKSCVECLTSFCAVHLQSHYRAAGLKRHTLMSPVAGPEERICEEHGRLLTLFCRTDEQLLCARCAQSHDASHHVTPVQQAHKESMSLLRHADAKVRRTLQERRLEVQNVKESVARNKKDIADMTAKTAQDLTELVFDIQRAVEGKQRAAEEKADDFICHMEQEIVKLQVTKEKLEYLAGISDDVHFLRSFQTSSLQPDTARVSTFSYNRDIQCVRTFLSQLQTSVTKLNGEINRPSSASDDMLRVAQRYEVDVTLDPESAHPRLILSDDGKQVRYNINPVSREKYNNPTSFRNKLAVLGQRGFSACRFYFEVFVGEKTEWSLGLATKSLKRKEAIVPRPGCGLWVIRFIQDRFEAFTCPGVTLLTGKTARVGTFVDWERGDISFFDVDTATRIHSFTECVFTEELYPYLNPCNNEYGSNLDPMKIVSSMR